MRKGWIVGIVILILILVVFFFPKHCGGSGGVGGYSTQTTCSCIGIEASSLLNRFITDYSYTSCYGICLKNTCEKKVSTLQDQIDQLFGGCAGVQDIYWNECCNNWAAENNISHIQCVGNWTIENNTCTWRCS